MSCKKECVILMEEMQEIDTTKHKALQGNHTTKKKGKKLKTKGERLHKQKLAKVNCEKNKNTMFDKSGARNNHCKSKSPITQQCCKKKARNCKHK